MFPAPGRVVEDGDRLEGPPDTEPGNPNPLDPAADALRAAYPGYRIWHVPAAGGRRAYWTAQPANILSSRGARGQLAAAIEADQPGDAGE